MKKLVNCLSLLIVVTLILSCDSSNDEETTQDTSYQSKIITVEELSKYFFLEEYLPKPEAVDQVGSFPFLMYTAIAGNQNEYIIDESFYHQSLFDFNNGILFNPENGITKVITKYGYFEISKDNNGKIYVLGNQHYQNPNGYIINKRTPTHTQLIEKGSTDYDDITFQAIEGISGYFRFKNKKWRYKTESAPTVDELTWSFDIQFKNIWFGKDNGTEQLQNIFFIIPKGIGWKGKYTDKEILLVNTGKNNKILKELAVCIKI